MGITYILLCIFVYGFGGYFLIHELFMESSHDYRRIVGEIIVLLLFTIKIWKRWRFEREKKERFETQYSNLIRDAFQGDEKNYESFMLGIDYVILNKPKKAMPILKELLKKAGTVNELYAVNYFIAECCEIMEQHEEAMDIYRDLIRMDAERVHAWYLLGASYIEREMYEKAIEVLEHGVSLLGGEPKMAADVYATLASAYVCREKYVEAKKYIDMAYQLNHHKDIIWLKNKTEEMLDYPSETLDGVEVTPPFRWTVEKIGYPHRVFSGDVPEEEKMEIYQESLRRGKTEGFVPIFVIEDTLLCWMQLQNMGDMPYSQYVQDRMDQMGQIGQGKEILERKFMELTEPSPEYETYDLEELQGNLAGGVSQNYFGSIYDSFCLFEIPVDKPWEILLYIPFGVWMADVMLEETIAICQYWYEKYHALPAVVSADIIEFALPEPISEDEALEVAKEIFAFCPDRVLEDTVSGTLGELADSIRKSKVWFLQWY